MAFFTIAGISPSTTDFSEEEAISIGDETRSDSGQLRAAITTEKRRFRVKLLEVALSTFDTLRAAIDLGAQVTMTGDCIGGSSITVRAKMSGAEYQKDGLSFLVSASLQIEQV